MLAFSFSLIFSGIGNYIFTSKKIYEPFLVSKIVVLMFNVAMCISLIAVYTDTYWLYFFVLAIIGFCESTG